MTGVDESKVKNNRIGLLVMNEDSVGLVESNTVDYAASILYTNNFNLTKNSGTLQFLRCAERACARRGLAQHDSAAPRRAARKRPFSGGGWLSHCAPFVQWAKSRWRAATLLRWRTSLSAV